MKLSIGIYMSAVFLLIGDIAYGQVNKLPQIPQITVNVKDFGAVGDGKTLNTAALQKAFDLAGEKGGRVLIPEGEYLSGPLNMFGKTELYIAKGAVLRLINNIDAFPVENNRYRNFINVSKANDIKIDGEGTIDGQGQVWWPHVEKGDLKYRRPQMVFIEKAERVEIAGIKFLNPPNTHVSIKDAKEVYIHHITIEAPATSHNTDGINISAKNCTIEYCNISTGDDNIAMNFGGKSMGDDKPECENILIRNCQFGFGHGLSIGSFTSGGLKNMSVYKCSFDGTTSSIRIKTARGRGGLVENISYSDIEIRNSKWPVFISEYYPKEPSEPENDESRPVDNKTPVYRNIRLRNVTAVNCQNALLLWGVPESSVRGVSFENVKLSAKNGTRIYNASGVEFVNSVIVSQQGQQLQTFRAEVKGLSK